MLHFQGFPKVQLSISSFEDLISKDNPVRFIDVFSDKLDLAKIGFAAKTIQQEGRPSFESSLFVRLFLYGLSQWHQEQHLEARETSKFAGEFANIPT